MAYGVLDGSIAQINLEAKLNDQQMINTFHYQLAGGPSPDGLATMRSLLQSFEALIWEAQLKVLLSADYEQVAFRGQWIFPTRFQAAVSTPVTNHGTAGGDAAPSGVSVVGRRKGDRANKHNQGRIYLPGIPINNITASEIDDAAFPAINTALNASMLVTLTGDIAMTALPVIFNLKIPATITPVTSSSTDQIVRYQRRREIGKGK